MFSIKFDPNSLAIAKQDFETKKFKCVDAVGFEDYVRNYRALVATLKSLSLIDKFLVRHGMDIYELSNKLNLNDSMLRVVSYFVKRELPLSVEEYFGNGFVRKYYEIQEKYYLPIRAIHPFHYICHKNKITMRHLSELLGHCYSYGNTCIARLVIPSSLGSIAKYNNILQSPPSSPPKLGLLHPHVRDPNLAVIDYIKRDKGTEYRNMWIQYFKLRDNAFKNHVFNTLSSDEFHSVKLYFGNRKSHEFSNYIRFVYKSLSVDMVSIIGKSKSNKYLLQRETIRESVLSIHPCVLIVQKYGGDLAELTKIFGYKDSSSLRNSIIRLKLPSVTQYENMKGYFNTLMGKLKNTIESCTELLGNGQNTQKKYNSNSCGSGIDTSDAEIVGDKNKESFSDGSLNPSSSDNPSNLVLSNQKYEALIKVQNEILNSLKSNKKDDLVLSKKKYDDIIQVLFDISSDNTESLAFSTEKYESLVKGQDDILAGIKTLSALSETIISFDNPNKFVIVRLASINYFIIRSESTYEYFMKMYSRLIKYVVDNGFVSASAFNPFKFTKYNHDGIRAIALDINAEMVSYTALIYICFLIHKFIVTQVLQMSVIEGNDKYIISVRENRVSRLENLNFDHIDWSKLEKLGDSE